MLGWITCQHQANDACKQALFRAGVMLEQNSLDPETADEIPYPDHLSLEACPGTHAPYLYFGAGKFHSELLKTHGFILLADSAPVHRKWLKKGRFVLYPGPRVRFLSEKECRAALASQKKHLHSTGENLVKKKDFP